MFQVNNSNVITKMYLVKRMTVSRKFWKLMVPVFSLSTIRNIFLTKTSLFFIPRAAANSILVRVVAMSLGINIDSEEKARVT